jgi:hypothetical protein
LEEKAGEVGLENVIASLVARQMLREIALERPASEKEWV